MHRAASVFIYTLIFATGAAGLVYQIVWQRYLARLLGSDSTAIAIILAVFLGGLSLGYLLCGRWTTRLKNFLRGYALLELMIGIWALLFPILFSAVDSMTRSWSFAPTPMLLLQGIFCAVTLTAIPTICMGGTIPMLTRGLSATLADATRTHAMVYGINTAGAFAGALLAGFFLIAAFGLPMTLRIAAAVNLITAFVFAVFPFRQRMGDAPVTTADRMSAAPSGPPRWTLYCIGFLSGVYVMMLENILVRITNLSFGSSSYSFSIIVAIFVLCIALGSIVVGNRKALPHSTLFWNQAGIATFLLLLFLLLDKGPYLAHLIRICFQPNPAGFWFYNATVLVALLLILIVPVSLAGATLPLLFHQLKRDLATVGAKAGTLLSFNALGCMLGSLGGGLLLYSFLNSGEIFLGAVILASISALMASWTLKIQHRFVAFLLLALAGIFISYKPFFDEQRFAIGTFRLQSATPFSFVKPSTFYEYFRDERAVKFFKEGPAGTVAVIKNSNSRAATIPDLPFNVPHFPTVQSNSSTLSIYVNGKSDSDVIADRETLKLLAHLPALWSEKREKALIIGLGTGVTAGELGLHADLKSLDVAEISPLVVETLPFFGNYTHNIHEDPRLKIHIGDAFRVLRRSSEKWDVIVSEPSNLWVTGVDQLFSRGFYQLVKTHLNDGGAFLQWVQQYAFNTEGLGIILTTLQTEFPHFTVFQGTKGDLLILARTKPFTKEDRKRMEEVFHANPSVRESLAEIDIRSPKDLFRRERPLLAVLAGRLSHFGIETQDRPRLHYLAGKTFFTGEEIGGENPWVEGANTILSRKVFEETPFQRGE